MIHPETIEELKKMTPAQRLALGLSLMDMAWGFLKHLAPEERQRRLALAREPWNPPPRPMER